MQKNIILLFSTPIKDIPAAALDTILYGGDDSISVNIRFGKKAYTYDLAFDGLVKMLTRWYKDTSSEKIRRWAEAFMVVDTCPECKGQRLKKESLHFIIKEKNISDVAELDLVALNVWLQNIENGLSERRALIAKDILKELRLRLGFLLHVGLTYLSLNRPARTLSGGEAQRIRLATQIGAQLTGILIFWTNLASDCIKETIKN